MLNKLTWYYNVLSSNVCVLQNEIKLSINKVLLSNKINL